MVPRRVGARGALRCLGAAAVMLAIVAPAATAANRRVAISGYKWSQPEIQLNVGEHVTWYWTGPDLMHSVTGQSANAKGWDSDPNINQPDHRLGDTYQVDFTQPGVYQFQCKLHGSVRGEIVVSADPGDPVTEPDPVPRTNVDLRAPRVTDLRLAKHAVRRGRRIVMRYSLGEKASLSADFYRYRGGGTVYAGYETFKGHVGFNHFGLGGRGKHFRARPGRYRVVIRATDGAANESRARRVGVRILPASRRR